MYPLIYPFTHPGLVLLTPLTLLSSPCSPSSLFSSQPFLLFSSCSFHPSRMFSFTPSILAFCSPPAPCSPSPLFAFDDAKHRRRNVVGRRVTKFNRFDRFLRFPAFSNQFLRCLCDCRSTATRSTSPISKPAVFVVSHEPLRYHPFVRLLVSLLFFEGLVRLHQTATVSPLSSQGIRRFETVMVLSLLETLSRARRPHPSRC